MSDDRKACLAAVTKAIVTRDLDLLTTAVRSAYAAGARHSDLLTAVDIAKALADVLPRIVTRAYRVIDDWQGIAARRGVGQSDVAGEVA